MGFAVGLRSDYDSIYVQLITSELISTILENIYIYPNPSNGIFSIKTEAQYIINKLEIYNILGENIYSINATFKKGIYNIDISFIQNGIYYVKIYENDKIFIRKVVKQSY